MALAVTHSAVVLGVGAHIVEVQAHISQGLPGLALVGLPDAAMNESRDRVRAAISNSGLHWPTQKVTVGLSPAALPKRGSGLDVAIALAVLAADGQLPPDAVRSLLALGELGLDGSVRPVVGALAVALAMKNNGSTSRLLVGEVVGAQLAQVAGLDVMSALNLRSIVRRLRGEPELDRDVGVATVDHLRAAEGHEEEAVDMSEVGGQRFAKFGLEVAAAGGHHIALLGRAGVGKTLLAERFPGLLPDLDDDAALEVTALHQIAGRHGGTQSVGLVRRPPYVAPHHTATRAALVGGGSEDKPTVGAVTLAHRGVLFLDEAAEFDPSALDSLREPLEGGVVRISRAGFNLENPARFQLVLATNPCPCGNALDDHQVSAVCRCTPTQRRRYLGRLSGPLMDRIDVRTVLERPTAASLAEPSDDSATVRGRVHAARAHLADRLSSSRARTVAEISPRTFAREWGLTGSAHHTLDVATRRDSLRGRDRVARLSWTISALRGSGCPERVDVESALEFRANEAQWAA